MWGAHRLRPVVPRQGPAWSPWVGWAQSVPWCDGSAQRGVSAVPRVEAQGRVGRRVPRAEAQMCTVEACAEPQVAAAPGWRGPGPSWPFLILYLKGRNSVLGIQVFTPLRSGNIVLLRQWGAF